MINYCLSFIEDISKELLHKKLICLGAPKDIEKRLKPYFIPYQQIECCCNIIDEPVCDTSNYPFRIYELQYLNTVDISKYIFLIVSDDVDQIKERLRLLKLCYQNEVINCYKLPLINRYYGNPDDILTHRFFNPLSFWKDYYLNKTGVEEQVSNSTRCIPRAILVLTTKCNLRCKDCIALTPYYKNGYHVPIVTLFKSIDSFLSNIDYCYCLELLGGEPFLYPDIDVVLEYVINQNKIATIQITTNGLAFVKESTIALLKNKKIHVRISEYNNCTTTNRRRFQEKLHAAGVNYWIQSDIAWMPIGDLHKRNANPQTLMDEYSLCFEGINCKTILNGKLYSCTFASRIADLGLATDIEYVDLLKDNVSWEQLFDFWRQPISMACDYCKMMDPNAHCIPSAIQV